MPASLVQSLLLLWSATALKFESRVDAGVQLPSFADTDHGHKLVALAQKSHWWASVGGRVYHTPPSSVGLSQDVSHYYYAVGSRTALNEELQRQRVGGDARWHLFHLPRGAEDASGVNTGDRRTSLSALVQLQAGMNVSDAFPIYPVPQGYRDPLASGNAAVRLAAQAAENEITPKVVMQYLENLTTSFPTRSATNSTATEQVETWLRGHFSLMNLTQCSQSFQSTSGHLSNVVALIRGQTNDTVTIGAHYDSRPFDGAAPGADDNGSGLAALLVIAKAFAQSGVQPHKSVYFVAFAGEELGLLGSDAFAAQLKTPSGGIPPDCRLDINNNHTHQALILDEIGWASPNLTKLTVNLESHDSNAELMDHLAKVNALQRNKKLEVVHSSNPFGSDHMSWLNRGFPAVLCINGDDNKYPGYHTSSDVLGNINPDLLTGVTKMTLGALFRLAHVDSRTEAAS